MTSDTNQRQTEQDAENDIYASSDVGEKYSDSVYRNINYGELDVAPETSNYPKTDGEDGFRIAEMPKVPKLRHIVGPSAIMLGSALGSGETIFWPVLIAQNGWAYYWAFWVGVITQFFINTELQRWAIATGESIFRGFARLSPFWPLFFLAFGFFHLGWPGWVAGSAEVFVAWTGVVPQGSWPIIAIILMIIIWLSYQAGPLIYNIVEQIQTVMMFIAIVLAVVIALLVGSLGQLANVPAGAVNFGALPPNMDIAVFLGGLAYAGAGGYGNLAQGVWAREKGYGMGTYQGRLKNPLRGEGEPEEIHDGYTFEPTEINLKRWRGWWKVTQLEHFLTFVLGLFIVGTIMMTIAARYAAGTELGAINMWLNGIIPEVGPAAGFMLYALLFIALFSTQYANTEIFVRNSVDILYQVYGRRRGMDMSRAFLGLLTLFTLWGIIIIGLQVQQPFILLVIGAAAAGVMMWPYSAVTIILNTTRLPEHTQPGWGRTVAMWWATGFYGYFSVILIGDTLVTYLGLDVFATTLVVVGSGIGSYVLWVFTLFVQIYTMYVSARAKLNADDTVDNATEAQGFLF
jgi:hypothetical protein